MPLNNIPLRDWERQRERERVWEIGRVKLTYRRSAIVHGDWKIHASKNPEFKWEIERYVRVEIFHQIRANQKKEKTLVFSDSMCLYSHAISCNVLSFCFCYLVVWWRNIVCGGLEMNFSQHLCFVIVILLFFTFFLSFRSCLGIFAFDSILFGIFSLKAIKCWSLYILRWKHCVGFLFQFPFRFFFFARFFW